MWSPPKPQKGTTPHDAGYEGFVAPNFDTGERITYRRVKFDL